MSDRVSERRRAAAACPPLSPVPRAPFLDISNILAFSVLALKVHRYLDGERLTGR